MKQRVRYEGEFLKERWFSEDAKQAMMAFVNKKKKWNFNCLSKNSILTAWRVIELLGVIYRKNVIIVVKSE